MTHKLANGGTYYGPDWLYHVGEAFNNTKGWLFDEPWTKEKYDAFRGIYAFGPARDYLDYLLDTRDAEWYLYRNGMDYSDIRDPRNLPNASSGANVVGSAFRMVSKNVDRLYR